MTTHNRESLLIQLSKNGSHVATEILSGEHRIKRFVQIQANRNLAKKVEANRKARAMYLS
jgi:hypothetical protein